MLPVWPLHKAASLRQPLPVQFWKWFVAMLQGDLGASLYGSNQPVTTIILEALPRTLSLAFLSFVIALAIAVAISAPFGLFAVTIAYLATATVAQGGAALFILNRTRKPA